MVYQPQVDVITKKVCGYEALVRMKEPGVYPGQFIPIAEKNGWIWRIGRITTSLVIRQLAAWRDAGKELHPVSINFSSNQLNDIHYLDYLENLLQEYAIPPELVEIEITEGIYLDRSAQADELFKRFKKLGIRLLMDDFGTGYSSLGYLTYIPVDVIKLDKSLVDNYLVEGKDLFIKDIICSKMFPFTVTTRNISMVVNYNIPETFRIIKIQGNGSTHERSRHLVSL